MSGILSPDYYAAIPVGDIEGEEFDALRTVWPAAYDAMASLLKAEDEGWVQPHDEMFRGTLYDLIRRCMP